MVFVVLEGGRDAGFGSAEEDWLAVAEDVVHSLEKIAIAGLTSKHSVQASAVAHSGGDGLERHLAGSIQHCLSAAPAFAHVVSWEAACIAWAKNMKALWMVLLPGDVAEAAFAAASDDASVAASVAAVVEDMFEAWAHIVEAMIGALFVVAAHAVVEQEDSPDVSASGSADTVGDSHSSAAVGAAEAVAVGDDNHSVLVVAVRMRCTGHFGKPGEASCTADP